MRYVVNLNDLLAWGYLCWSRQCLAGSIWVSHRNHCTFGVAVHGLEIFDGEFATWPALCYRVFLDNFDQVTDLFPSQMLTPGVESEKQAQPTL